MRTLTLALLVLGCSAQLAISAPLLEHPLFEAELAAEQLAQATREAVDAHCQAHRAWNRYRARATTRSYQALERQERWDRKMYEIHQERWQVALQRCREAIEQLSTRLKSAGSERQRERLENELQQAEELLREVRAQPARLREEIGNRCGCDHTGPFERPTPSAAEPQAPAGVEMQEVPWQPIPGGEEGIVIEDVEAAPRPAPEAEHVHWEYEMCEPPVVHDPCYPDGCWQCRPGPPVRVRVEPRPRVVWPRPAVKRYLRWQARHRRQGR